jgi:hypothetical protein
MSCYCKVTIRFWFDPFSPRPTAPSASADKIGQIGEPAVHAPKAICYYGRLSTPPIANTASISRI